MFNKHKYSLIAHGPTARDTIFRPLIRQKKWLYNCWREIFSLVLPVKVKAVLQNEQSMGFFKSFGLKLHARLPSN